MFGAPGASAHFRLVSLVAAGRDLGSFGSKPRNCGGQIVYIATLVRSTHPDWQVDVALTDLAGRARWLDEAILQRVAEYVPEATCRMDPTRVSGRGYYVDACYKIFAGLPSGERRSSATAGAPPGPDNSTVTTRSGR